MRDLYAQLYERRFRRPEFLERESDTVCGAFDRPLVGHGSREFIPDVDEVGDCARPSVDRGRTDFPERAFSVDVLRRKAR